MIGKIMPYVVVGYIQATLIILGARYVFDVPMIGSLTLLARRAGLFIAANLARGLHVLDHRHEPASGDADDVVLPAAVDPAVGLHVPVPRHAGLGAMDRAKRCRNTHFLRIVRGILLKGNGPAEIWPHVWPLLIFLFVVGSRGPAAI